MNILDYEEKYSKKYIDLSNNLSGLFNKIVANGKIDLKDNEVSKAILTRLKHYYISQEIIKSVLNKRYAPPAADFFVETVVFYIKAVFEIYKLHLDVFSEKTIKPKKGSMRPDISIWYKSNVIAILECKTQLGWNRGNWKTDFMEREERLKKEYPEALAFLVVITSSNWSGFGKDKEVGVKYFCLSNEWPYNIKIDRIDDYILNPIEPIITFFIQKFKR